MALPAGISTAIITAGAGYDTVGGSDYTTSVHITPSASLVWTATGDVIFGPKIPVQVTTTAGQQATFELPHVNQLGFRSGGRDVLWWSYRIVITSRGNGPAEVRKIDNFQPVVGQDTIDLDQLADSAPVARVNGNVPVVTDLAGLTGSLTRDDLEKLGIVGTMTAAPDPNNPDLLILTFPAASLTVDGMSVVLPIGA